MQTWERAHCARSVFPFIKKKKKKRKKRSPCWASRHFVLPYWRDVRDRIYWLSSSLLHQKFCTVTQYLIIDEMIGHCLKMRTSHEVVEISGIFRSGFTCARCHPCHSNFYEYMVLIRWRETPCSAVSWTLTWVDGEINHLLWLRRGSWMVFCNAGVPLESW